MSAGVMPVVSLPADHDRFLGPGAGGLVALERDPHQVIAEAEGVDDLGRGRQQRNQAHPASLDDNP